MCKKNIRLLLHSKRLTMKVPKTFIPEKDLTNKVQALLVEKPSSLYDHVKTSSLYDHVKKVYEGIESKNIILLYGPPGAGKTFTSKKTKEELSKEYDICNIYLPPVDSVLTFTKEEYSQEIEREIISALSSNKKVYIDISYIETFSKPAQEAIDTIFTKYKHNDSIVFVLESDYKYLTFYFHDESKMDIEFTKE